MSPLINKIVPRTEVEGPGKRYAVWFQGCPLRCPGCCNPQMHAFKGESKDVQEILLDLEKHAFAVEGVSLLGGEPWAQSEYAARIAVFAKRLNLGVMVFSGFTFEELYDKFRVNSAKGQQLWDNTDLLVSGPFLQEQASNKRRWVGSDNQEIHFLTDRYKHLKNSWPKGDKGFEIHYDGSSITINGHPIDVRFL